MKQVRFRGKWFFATLGILCGTSILISVPVSTLAVSSHMHLHPVLIALIVLTSLSVGGVITALSVLLGIVIPSEITTDDKGPQDLSGLVREARDWKRWLKLGNKSSAVEPTINDPPSSGPTDRSR